MPREHVDALEHRVVPVRDDLLPALLAAVVDGRAHEPEIEAAVVGDDVALGVDLLLNALDVGLRAFHSGRDFEV